MTWLVSELVSYWGMFRPRRSLRRFSAFPWHISVRFQTTIINYSNDLLQNKQKFWGLLKHHWSFILKAWMIKWKHFNDCIEGERDLNNSKTLRPMSFLSAWKWSELLLIKEMTHSNEMLWSGWQWQPRPMAIYKNNSVVQWTKTGRFRSLYTNAECVPENYIILTIHDLVCHSWMLTEKNVK